MEILNDEVGRKIVLMSLSDFEIGKSHRELKLFERSEG